MNAMVRQHFLFLRDMLAQYAQRAKITVSATIDQCVYLFLGIPAHPAQLTICSRPTSSFFRICSSLCDHAPSAINSRKPMGNLEATQVFMQADDEPTDFIHDPPN